MYKGDSSECSGDFISKSYLIGGNVTAEFAKKVLN